MEKIAVVGLGYVGLPLALAFGRLLPTVGIDISENKISAYRDQHDPAGEMPRSAFAAANQIEFATDFSPVKDADYVIITVPTPINSVNQPDLKYLIEATRSAAAFLKPGATVVYESTVYPGATEEVCVPILEEQTGKKWLHDFFVGYSPERMNPGDAEHTLETITKVVSGDTEETATRLHDLYAKVVKSGVYIAPSIRTAEAAKVIENTQRDINIALVNELAIIFKGMKIDTDEVLKAASTKWNFLPFKPGLVGGHCIGVDPYYLTHKAQSLGYHPEVILAGRRINDNMGKFVAQQSVKCMVSEAIDVRQAEIAILGLSFKENCKDIRNSKVIDIYHELKTYGVNVYVHDPEVNASEAKREYGIDVVSWDDLPELDTIILAVPHASFLKYSVEQYREKLKIPACFIDVKSVFDHKDFYNTGVHYWRL